MSPPDHRPSIDAPRARQGRRGRPVVWVLVISTLLAATALFASWLRRADDMAATEPNNARQPADAAAFDTPAPADITQQSGRPDSVGHPTR